MNTRLLLAFALVAASVVAAQAQIIVRVEVDGVPASYDGTPPQIRNGRVLVPVRGVFEQFGAEVVWDEQKKEITATRKGRRIWMRIGDATATRDGVPVALEVPPQIIEGNTLVPLRFIGEALGVKVGWNGLEKIVIIETGGGDGEMALLVAFPA